MQYPVPQFTDVEDKIFGPLTIKQFGIVFGAGVVIFLGFSATKSVLFLIFLLLVIGLPALGFAFVKINGRPIYNIFGNLFKFITSPKVLVFHKEAPSGKNGNDAGKPVAMQNQAPAVAESTPDTQAHLRQVQDLLRKTAAEERDVAGKMR